MLKKKIAMILAAAMLTLSASSAFAAFADLELIRVYYERTTGTLEYATDLGNVNTLVTNGAHIAGTWGANPSAANAGNLFAVYFAIDHSTTGAGVGDLWVSGGATAPVAVGTLGFNVAKSGTTSLFSGYNALGGPSVVQAQSDPNAYVSKLSASQGSMGNAINIATRPTVEASLSDLVLGNAASVTQNLYFFTNANTANSIGAALTTIITNADGSTDIVGTSTATPIPAAFYLMGSGLLGLVGLRRRNNA